MIAYIDCIDFHPVKLPSTAFLFDTQSPPVIDPRWTHPFELQPNIIPLTGDMNLPQTRSIRGHLIKHFVASLHFRALKDGRAGVSFH